MSTCTSGLSSNSNVYSNINFRPYYDCLLISKQPSYCRKPKKNTYYVVLKVKIITPTALHTTNVDNARQCGHSETNCDRLLSFGYITVRYKASKMCNQLPSSLKGFLSVKNFSNKLEKVLTSS